MTSLLIGCLVSTVSCGTSKGSLVITDGATTNCTKDCWPHPVSKAFVLEHATTFDQLIRARAALKECQRKGNN